MIDVGDKDKTKRTAKASAFVKLDAELIKMIRENKAPKGNIIETARLAGIMAAKKTSELIPLCHNIEMDKVSVDFEFKADGIRIEAFAKTVAKTGIEMETMAAVSVAALTVYDMVKMFNRSVEITDVMLLYKDGGKDGVYER